MKSTFYLALLLALLSMPVGTGFANYFLKEGYLKARRITLVLVYAILTTGIAVAGYAAYWESNYGEGKKVADVLVEKRCKTVLRGTPKR